MNTFFNLGTEPDRTPITIRVLLPILILRAGEPMPRHAEAGELVTVGRCTLASLTPEDYEEMNGLLDAALVKKTVRLDDYLNTEQIGFLDEIAQDHGMSIQDYLIDRSMFVIQRAAGSNG